MPPDKSAHLKMNSQQKTNVVGTQKNRLNKQPKHLLKLMGKKIITILRKIFMFISKPMTMNIISTELSGKQTCLQIRVCI